MDVHAIVDIVNCDTVISRTVLINKQVVLPRAPFLESFLWFAYALERNSHCKIATRNFPARLTARSLFQIFFFYKNRKNSKFYIYCDRVLSCFGPSFVSCARGNVGYSKNMKVVSNEMFLIFIRISAKYVCDVVV